MKVDREIKKLELIIWVIVLVAILGAFLGWSADFTNQIIQWLVSIFIGMVGMIVSGALVKAFTGDLLEGIKIPLSIGGFTFRVSVFFIVTLIVKLLIFGF